MTDRFDLEQQIMSCWNIVEDLKLLSESKISEANRKIFIDGLIVKYELKFDKMFSTFEDCVSNDLFLAKDHAVDFDGLEAAYDDPFDMTIQDLNNGYYPGN